MNKFYENYEKQKTVGQGAFGTATLYKRKNDGKQVVSKEVFLIEMDKSERKSALNEVEILATLNHPNIIKYLGSFQKDESLIIIMEYADGGNLAQLINAKKNKNEIFTEKSILNIISQITAAIAYMHSHKILHRDLKAANIFLNMSGNVKVGDFGISKMLNTRSQAQTMVGTPYYLSPEMCEGSDYNEKSDIWAIGCILYELSCLKKPFEAMTLPVLIQKIITCIYEDIPGIYSEDLSELVHSILQKNPVLRPSAAFINETAIQRIQKKNHNLDTLSLTQTFKLGLAMERSILFQMTEFGDDPKIIPLELPHKKIIDFAVSLTHQIVITEDNNVYTWGNNNFGQLGVKDTTNRSSPTCVNNLRGEMIEKCGAGSNFSIFLSKKGLIYSCGDGRQGCLGHGNWDKLQTPMLITSLDHETLTEISCGYEHVAALSKEGQLFTWGSSKNGQLGQEHTQCRCKPLAIKLNNSAKIKNIFTGPDATVLLLTNGQILVSGNNNYGKLGIDNQDKITIFTPLRNFKEKIVTITIGAHHMIMLSESGTIAAFGRNLESQLGVKLKNKMTMIAAGPTFTIASDQQNVVWFWGYPYILSQNMQINMKNTNSIVPLDDQTTIINNFEFTNETVKTPRPLLAFYSSVNHVKMGQSIVLDTIKIGGDNLFLLAHTSVPPPLGEFTAGETSVAPTTLTNLPNTT